MEVKKTMAEVAKIDLQAQGADVLEFMKSWAFKLPVAVAMGIWAITQIPAVGTAIGTFVSNLIAYLP